MSSVLTKNTFPPDTRISLHARTVDYFEDEPLGDALQTAKAGDYGDVSFSGLPDGGRFWLVADPEDVPNGPAAVGMVAKGPDVETPKRPAKKAGKSAAARKRSAAAKKGAATKRAKAAQGKARGKAPQKRVVSGQRGTANSRGRK